MGTSIIFGFHALRGVLLASVLLGASTAQAQSGTTPQTIPGLDGFSLPASRPTPRPVPEPAPTTRPTNEPTPTASATPPPSPSPRATPTPRAPAPRPSTSPTPRPVATPRGLPVPIAPPPPRPAATPLPAVPTPSPRAATPEIAPLPLPSPSNMPPEPLPPVVVPAPRPSIAWDSLGPWGWVAVAGGTLVLAVIGFGLWWRRRPPSERAERRRDTRHQLFALGTADDAPADVPPPSPASPAVADRAPARAAPPEPAPAPPSMLPPVRVTQAARAMIELALLPKRAGTNLLSASVEYQLSIHNSGALPASGVRLDIRLLSVGAAQDGILAALFASPVAQPITAPFDVAAGATLTLDGMAMHPKETLELLGVGEPALFVPVLSVNVRYGWSGGAGQTGRSYVVGMVRGEGAKLQPFRRDGVARMFDTVAAVEYAMRADG